MPIATLQSGPVNSLRGAAFLSQASDAIVLDIGGTTTDVGMLVHSLPRPAALDVSLCGVRTNFQMPDVLSIGRLSWQLSMATGPALSATQAAVCAAWHEIYY